MLQYVQSMGRSEIMRLLLPLGWKRVIKDKVHMSYVLPSRRMKPIQHYPLQFY